uniref:Uncharacterized protein n=1 Tax=Hyaloperonospora arabidopsidis (strain Emoy2) TaxID=559515 RepID=M4BHY8_HYAAE
MSAGGSELSVVESGPGTPTVARVSYFPDTESVLEFEDPKITRFNEVFVVIADLAAHAATGWSAGRIVHLMAGELGDWFDSAESEGFATLAGRRPEDRDLAKVARTTSFSTLEPSSKGSNSTRDEGTPDASEGCVDEARVADARSFEVFFECADTRTDVRRGCLSKLWEKGGRPKWDLSPNWILWAGRSLGRNRFLSRYSRGVVQLGLEESLLALRILDPPS